MKYGYLCEERKLAGLESFNTGTFWQIFIAAKTESDWLMFLPATAWRLAATSLMKRRKTFSSGYFPSRLHRFNLQKHEICNPPQYPLLAQYQSLIVNHFFHLHFTWSRQQWRWRAIRTWRWWWMPHPWCRWLCMLCAQEWRWRSFGISRWWCIRHPRCGWLYMLCVQEWRWRSLWIWRWCFMPHFWCSWRWIWLGTLWRWSIFQNVALFIPLKCKIWKTYITLGFVVCSHSSYKIWSQQNKPWVTSQIWAALAPQKTVAL